ncbi:GNAT family N-acetyltransferase [Paenibacillus sp. PR3]|uniref:GNAT family N-acetyltransferase n=1 Tax=Paenibacillus terricola TaxID=2763503 RepID=A0ABR8N471_9BACL|nr:GNAT family N-acetyltransferase [Paenibacillus terricola]
MNFDFYRKQIVLENDLVRLVPFNKELAAGLRPIINDFEITRYSGNHITNEDDFNNYIDRVNEVRMTGQGYPFLVIDKQSGQIAGTTRLGNIRFDSKRLEIGWTWYSKPFRGSGINKACKYELLKFAFETMHFNRVQFSVDRENVRSQRAVLKLGATQEGIFRCNYMNASGECRDDIYYSIIRTEWEEIKRTNFVDCHGVTNY